MKHYEPFTYSITLKDHQVIEPGDTINDNGVKMKVVAIQSVQKMNGTSIASLTVRELPGGDEK